VTGYVEDDDPVGTVRSEIEEETGLGPGDVEVVRTGDPFDVVDTNRGRRWRVHPFLVDATTRDVRLNEESQTGEWTHAPAIRRRETVPELWRSYVAVAPSVTTVAADTEHGSAHLSIRALEVLRDVAGSAAVDGEGMAPVIETAEALLAARPGMAAVGNRVNRAMHGAESPEAVEDAAAEAIQRAYDADDAAARTAAEIVDGGTAVTLSRSGTVFEALRRGASAAIVAESRPAREGVGVAERLAAAGLDVTLCTDAALAQLLATREVEAVLVGADAVLPDGRVVNKTGTRSIALAADREDVPCYAVAAADKVQGADTLHLEAGPPDDVYDGDAQIEAVNPTFGVTPADLLSGVVTERGILEASEIRAVSDDHRALATWRSKDR
jgi:translation initiation factor 2B subunit (eIF-2B alpha/beta/delta family)